MIESWRSAVAAGDLAWQHAARANLAAWQPHHARLKAVLSHEGPVEAAAFSPDGKTVLTGGDDLPRGSGTPPPASPSASPCPIEARSSAVAFSPDGKTVLTGGSDKTARLWDTATGQPVGSSFPHGGEVMAVAYSPDGRTILTGSTDRTAQRWDAVDPSSHRSALRTSERGALRSVQPGRQVPPHGERGRDGAALGRHHRNADRSAPGPSGRGALRGV